MKLLLDVGNSRIKWAWLTDGGEFEAGPPCPHADESLSTLMADIARAGVAPGEVYISHVGGTNLREALARSIHRQWRDTSVHWLRAEPEAYGVRCAYAQPQRLGADRWAALIGARALWSGPVAIMDFGTAITLDGLEADGRHAGGLIAPGYHLMLRALHSDTGELAAAGVVDEAPPAGLFAADTGNAINSGIHHCLRGLVMEVTGALASWSPGGCTLVATGGGLPPVRAWLPDDAVVAPDLVLHGLARVAREGE